MIRFGFVRVICGDCGHEAVVAPVASCLKARMLLQVHDELVFEAPDSEVDQVRELAREAMAGVASFQVPLEVDVGAGHSWADEH